MTIKNPVENGATNLDKPSSILELGTLGPLVVTLLKSAIELPNAAVIWQHPTGIGTQGGNRTGRSFELYEVLSVSSQHTKQQRKHLTCVRVAIACFETRCKFKLS